jgi:hypothetical protein
VKTVVNSSLSVASAKLFKKTTISSAAARVSGV